MKELRLLCAEDEQGRTCWMTAFRLFKVARGVCIALTHTHTHTFPAFLACNVLSEDVV